MLFLFLMLKDAKDIIALFMTQLEKWVGLHLLL